MKFLFIVSLFFISSSCLAQEYYTGIPETKDTSLEKMKQKTTLITANYKSLGSSASLRKYCPTPGDQSKYSTCAAWSTAYAARTIVEAQKNGWRSDVISMNTFSPMFIYKLNNPYDDDCSQGAHPADLLELMQRYGVPPLKDFSANCQIPGSSDYQKAAPFKINALQKIFYITPYEGNIVSSTDVLKIKKSISEGNPVIISFVCPRSFFSAKEVWQPTESALTMNNYQHGRHAVCVVSFDDDKYGGAFEIMNSWGTGWGNGGFTWIPYDDFRKFTYAAVEMQKFEKQETASKLSGTVQILDANNAVMTATKQEGYRYKLDKAFSSGTRFKLYVKNNEPTNMYVIGADAKGNFSLLFPSKNSISPSLNYPNSTVAIPSEQTHIRMDNNTGRDYMVVIYTKKEDYDIDQVMKQLKSATGNFSEKVSAVLGKTIKNNNIQFEAKKIEFRSTAADKGDVVLLVEIEHI